MHSRTARGKQLKKAEQVSPSHTTYPQVPTLGYTQIKGPRAGGRVGTIAGVCYFVGSSFCCPFNRLTLDRREKKIEGEGGAMSLTECFLLIRSIQFLASLVFAFKIPNLFSCFFFVHDSLTNRDQKQSVTSHQPCLRNPIPISGHVFTL